MFWLDYADGMDQGRLPARHPPAFCVFGSGWAPESQWFDNINFDLDAGTDVTGDRFQGGEQKEEKNQEFGQTFLTWMNKNLQASNKHDPTPQAPAGRQRRISFNSTVN